MSQPTETILDRKLYLTIRITLLRRLLSTRCIMPQTKSNDSNLEYSFRYPHLILLSDKKGIICGENNTSSQTNNQVVILEIITNQNLIPKNIVNGLQVYDQCIPIKFIERIIFFNDSAKTSLEIPVRNVTYLKQKWDINESVFSKRINSDIKNERISALQKPANTKKQVKIEKIKAGIFGYWFSTNYKKDDIKYNYDDIILLIIRSLFKDRSVDYLEERYDNYEPILEKLSWYILDDLQSNSLFHKIEEQTQDKNQVQKIMTYSIFMKFLVINDSFEKDAHQNFTKSRFLDRFIDYFEKEMNWNDNSQITDKIVEDLLDTKKVFSSVKSISEHLNSNKVVSLSRYLPIFLKVFVSNYNEVIPNFKDQFDLSKRMVSFLYLLYGLMNGFAGFDNLDKEKFEEKNMFLLDDLDLFIYNGEPTTTKNSAKEDKEKTVSKRGFILKHIPINKSTVIKGYIKRYKKSYGSKTVNKGGDLSNVFQDFLVSHPDYIFNTDSLLNPKKLDAKENKDFEKYLTQKIIKKVIEVIEDGFFDSLIDNDKRFGDLIIKMRERLKNEER